MQLSITICGLGPEILGGGAKPFLSSVKHQYIKELEKSTNEVLKMIHFNIYFRKD